MDRRLLDLLCCPQTRQPLAPLGAEDLGAVNRAIAAGGVRRVDGEAQAAPLREGLITRDRKILYRVDDGIPVLLADEGIAATQIDGLR
ncbi:Trm112 family protein [Coralloluteibacterium stylophorae]|uniref:Trm112 family protein n=1 Tax=Coralloluteibacterium stylophorae TaxID=1776034 RepID=A0A8J7VUV4_9GAMM|nr:Trm112 family protein [Coralloluteibacterium stylophorae]MBS7456673.1 Trm112 family protein [Coralloluteibacterium stylophorae]